MKRLLQLFSAMTRWEKWTLSVFALLVIASSAVLVRRFVLQNTLLVPASGGTYIEGSVGELLPLNPWFIVQNDVNRDIVSLVFSGLQRYNPLTRRIEDDLATMTVSRDRKLYTLRLQDDLFWHDSTEELPHPVTADDVLFTFTTIQNPEFGNPLLRQNFRGVRIEKIDDRTIGFSLEEPYSFFSSNLTLGLLPQRSFQGIPPAKMDQAIDFGLQPVGAGPYRVKSVVRTDFSDEVTLERFHRSLPPVHRLDRIVFRIFQDYSTLLSDLRNLDGVRLVPRNEQGEPIIGSRFVAQRYSLPQYVALFFNVERSALQDQKLRLGLQQGTDKQKIVDAIHESVIVDTPLLEIDAADWRYKFDPNAAQGALLASRWNLPERVRLQRILEEEDANRTGPVHPPSSVLLLREGGTLTLSGAYTSIPRDARINGALPHASAAGSGTWIVQLPHLSGTGAIHPGTNLVKITASKNHIVDSFYVFGAGTAEEERRAVEERRLAKLYVDMKDGRTQGSERLTISDLFIDRGMLRRRRPGDPLSIRVNEKGEPLSLRLLTSDAPQTYRRVADEVRKQWAELGVSVDVEIASSPQEFQDRLLRRDYDVLLFGQSLLDNLDSYPYWHSSGVQKVTGKDSDLRQDAYNLSQYASFKADDQLEIIRSTSDDQERHVALLALREVLKNDAPAIFLYSPLYVYASHRNIFGIDLGALSLHSDRFLTVYKWYVKRERVFKSGIGWTSIFRWLPRAFGQ